jgi:hypothetical protein
MDGGARGYFRGSSPEIYTLCRLMGVGSRGWGKGIDRTENGCVVMPRCNRITSVPLDRHIRTRSVRAERRVNEFQDIAG